MTSGYCMKCKTKKEIKNITFLVTKNKNKAAKGQCKLCNTNMYAILPKDSKSKKTTKLKKSKKTTKSKKSKKTTKSKKY
jgi:hypothetical protein